MKIKIKCIECGTIVLRYHVKARPQLFCSRKCYLSSTYFGEKQRAKMIERDLSGKRSLTWVGDKVKYKSLHCWISKNFGPAKSHECEICHGRKGSDKLNWSNKDHKYTRERSLWWVLCKKCHVEYDMKMFDQFAINKDPVRCNKISVALKGRKFSPGHIKKLRNRKRTTLGAFV